VLELLVAVLFSAGIAFLARSIARGYETSRQRAARRAEIQRAAESAHRAQQAVNDAGSEAMEYRPYAAETASSLDEVADRARRAAVAARASSGAHMLGE
jgi:hypothetical protein